MPPTLTRYYYSSPIRDFLHQPSSAIVGELVRQSTHDITINQRNAWQEEIDLLKDILKEYAGRGSVYFEYNIPRLGRRIDTIVLIDGVVFILEFKTDQESFERADIAQVWDYALDLKNFHEGSHRRTLIPILVATNAPQGYMLDFVRYEDQVFKPLLSDKSHLKACIDEGLKHARLLVGHQPILAHPHHHRGRQCLVQQPFGQRDFAFGRVCRKPYDHVRLHLRYHRPLQGSAREGHLFCHGGAWSR